MQRPRVIWLLASLVGLLGACPARQGVSNGPRTGPGTPTARGAATRPVPPEWLETICDRVEDCAVERNVSLAKRYGGLPGDVSAARSEARQALVTGVVRRWCLMRVRQLGRTEAQRIHGCLKRTACSPFYQCADFPGARVRSRTPGPRSAAR